MSIKYEQPDFIQFIRNQHCIFCGGRDHWDGVNDVPVNSPCHIKTRGSGGRDYNNVLPACTPCHRDFEDWPNEMKVKYFPQAILITNKYFETRPEKYQEYIEDVKRYSVNRLIKAARR